MKIEALKRKVPWYVRRPRWALKQRLAGNSSYYGDGGTIHHTGHLDVEVRHGTVVAVWFRCRMLPFEQHDVDEHRAVEMISAQKHLPVLTGVEVRDPT